MMPRKFCKTLLFARCKRPVRFAIQKTPSLGFIVCCETRLSIITAAVLPVSGLWMRLLDSFPSPTNTPTRQWNVPFANASVNSFRSSNRRTRI